MTSLTQSNTQIQADFGSWDAWDDALMPYLQQKQGVSIGDPEAEYGFDKISQYQKVWLQESGLHVWESISSIEVLRGLFEFKFSYLS